MPITLTKGQNAPLPAGQIIVTVECAAPADLSALLVTDAGKVRTEADFVFFNQPVGPGVRCVAPDSGSGWQIQIEPDRVPAEIDQIRTVITLGEKGKRFGQFAPPTAHLLDASGTALADFELAGLQSESIVIALEIYRRANAWKVRAVGQGYAGGFAALVMDHGVSVDDEGEDEPSAGPPSGYPAAAPVPALVPPALAAPIPPPPQVPGYPPAPPTPPMPGYPPTPAVPAPGYPPTRAVPAPGYPPTPAVPAPTNPAAPGSAPTGTGEISLHKNARVDLRKGEKVSLRKADGSLLTRVRMGLGWDPLRGRGSIDLDASAVMYAGTTQLDLVAYTHLRSNDGSVTHSGDNLTGDGAGDDEVISIDLTSVPAQVTTIAFVVTSFLGQTFAKVSSAFCRLVDDTNGAELVRFTLDGGTPTTAMVMATLHRGADGVWRLQAIGQGIKARLPGKAAKLAIPFLTVS